MSTALAAVHGDREALVARVLDGFDLGLARADRQADRLADFRGGIRGAEVARRLERQRGKVAQRGVADLEKGIHGSCRAAGAADGVAWL
jgi:hypothetical protein